MFRRVRASSWVRAALCVAAIAALASSFGLHPEPLGAEAVAAHRGLASAHADDAPHSCVACLTHVAALVQPTSAVLAASAPSDRVFRIVRPSSSGRVAGRDLSGRSPPARP